MTFKILGFFAAILFSSFGFSHGEDKPGWIREQQKRWDGLGYIVYGGILATP